MGKCQISKYRKGLVPLPLTCDAHGRMPFGSRKRHHVHLFHMYSQDFLKICWSVEVGSVVLVLRARKGSSLAKSILQETMCPTQNRHQKIFNRRLCISVGGLWVCAGELDTLKIDKNSTDL